MELGIIINYSENNSHTDGNSKVWTESFARFLKVMLNQVLGSTPKITLKSEGDALSSSDLENTGLMICVMAPEFIASSQCVDAVEEFNNIISKDNVEVQRIFNVVKSQVPSTSQPIILQELLPYLLFDEENTAASNEFTDYFGPNAENIYWMKMVDLVYDLLDSLLALQDVAKKEGVQPIFARQTIYLAETTSELSVQRNVIKREIQRHGFKVLPDHTLPKDADSLVKTITDELEQSLMSVHLIGNEYGEMLEGLDRSVIDLQNKLAAEKAARSTVKNKLQRLIWINPNQQNSSDQQNSFIENIQRDLSTLESAEILQTPLEDFKNALRDELFKDQSKEAPSTPEFHLDNKKKNVYFIYDRIDKDEAILIKKELVKAGLNVIEPAFGDNLLDMRNSHLQKLKVFDLGVVFRGKVNDNWVRIKLLDMLKAPGLGRHKPILGRAIVGGKGVELVQEFYDDFDVDLLSVERNDTIADQIDQFIKNLEVAI
jgi:hypothetical protein